jgi:hypothetical protein
MVNNTVSMFWPDPGSEFFHPGSLTQVKNITDPDPHETVSKLSEKWMFIPDSDPDFFPPRSRIQG